MGDQDEAKAPSKPMAAIPVGMEKLEDGIRKLHDRLDPVMTENQKSEVEDKAEPAARSPLSARLQL